MILKKCNDIIFRISGILSTIFLGGIVILTFAQVITRYFIHYSITWSTEVSVYMLIWMVFLSCSMGYRVGKVTSLTLVLDKLPKKVQCLFRILIQLFMISFLVLTFIGNIEIVQAAWKKLSSILAFPLKYEYGSWSVVAVIMVLYCIEKIYFAIKDAFGKEEN